ncbi:hypothetical protein HaLaN_18349 [Haematococcus lacustris]|uniref:Uncharacterized protein n=1 Tax=Haematococcus lacustris TaxID=44745 RepID=A0A699ZN94_HAELA|nr:hypothetical protein HaLaN_18349 [Haematococcus lacustris]
MDGPMGREDVVRALLAQRRQAAGRSGLLQHGTVSEKQARVQQLLEQRRKTSAVTSPPASPPCGSIESPSQDGLLSPESSIMSFEFDAPARMMQSTARLTTGAAPSLQHKGISDTISSQAKRTPSQKPHAGNSMSEQDLTHQRHAHRQPTSHTPSLMGRHLVDQQLEQLGRVASSTSQETQSRGGQRATNPPVALASSTHREAAGSGRAAGNAPAAHVGVVTSSSQPAEQPPRRSLAELETMLSRAMNQMSMERDPASRQGDDGPFDISELWVAGGTALSQGSHSESYQESHLDTLGTAGGCGTPCSTAVLAVRSTNESRHMPDVTLYCHYCQHQHHQHHHQSLEGGCIPWYALASCVAAVCTAQLGAMCCMYSKLSPAPRLACMLRVTEDPGHGRGLVRQGRHRWRAR